MPQKTPTSNPNWKSRKFAARGKGASVESNDLQGLQAICKAEVSRYNSVKNTDSAYNGHCSRVGASWRISLQKERRMKPMGLLMMEFVLLSWQKHLTMDHLTDIQHSHWRCLLFRNASMKAAGRIQLMGFSVCSQHSGMICMLANYL